MSKKGFCPICKSSVRRTGVRCGKKRHNVICHHFFNGVCTGSGLAWCKALKNATHYRIVIAEIGTEL